MGGKRVGGLGEERTHKPLKYFFCVRHNGNIVFRAIDQNI